MYYLRVTILTDLQQPGGMKDHIYHNTVFHYQNTHL